MRSFKQFGARSAALMVGLLGLGGCSTVPRSAAQAVDVEAVTPLGAAVARASCVLRQGGAEWSVEAPWRVSVVTSADEIVVRCESAGMRGEVRALAAVAGSPGKGALIGGVAGLLLGAAIGANEDRKSSDAMCCGGLNQAAGSILGLAIGAGVGALASAPTYEYPAKVRVVLEPVVPPTPRP